MFADKHEIINSHLWFILFSTHPSYLLIRWMKMEMELSSTRALEDRSLVGLRRSAFAFATPFRILPVSPPSIAILFCPRWWWQVIFLILISRDNLHPHLHLSLGTEICSAIIILSFSLPLSYLFTHRGALHATLLLLLLRMKLCLMMMMFASH